VHVFKAHKTGLFVHKFWNKFQENAQVGCHHDEKIDTLSLQLLQEKIKFTVCRFVDLDWSLVRLVRSKDFDSNKKM
jgi:hypothetical protein